MSLHKRQLSLGDTLKEGVNKRQKIIILFSFSQIQKVILNFKTGEHFQLHRLPATGIERLESLLLVIQKSRSDKHWPGMGVGIYNPAFEPGDKNR